MHSGDNPYLGAAVQVAKILHAYGFPCTPAPSDMGTSTMVIDAHLCSLASNPVCCFSQKKQAPARSQPPSHPQTSCSRLAPILPPVEQPLPVTRTNTTQAQTT